MNPRERLLGAGLVLPDYGGRELGAVLAASLDAVGAGAAVTGRDAGADRERLGVPRASHAIVVVLDGLGQLQLEARKGHAPFLRSLLGNPLTAGFPTTTATSLALFGTGQPAGRTGMTGYSALNPRSGGLANLISWEGAYDAEQWQVEPSLLEEAAQSGLSVATVTKSAFAGSGLTRAALRGGALLGAGPLAARVNLALGRARAPGITYLYWGEIDATGHRTGWQSGEWVAALEDADRELARCAALLPRDAVLVITADHGMVDVGGEPRWDVATTPALAGEVALVAGEPRAVHLHVDARGGDADDVSSRVAERWQEALGGAAVVLTRVEATDSGILGPHTSAAHDRIGDVVVIMTGRSTVVDSRTQSPQSMGLVGMHGSLTPDELWVPLLVCGGAAT